MSECRHQAIEDGACRTCGACVHEVLLNRACLRCGEIDPPVTVKPVGPGPTVVPADRLRRRP